MKRKIFSLIMAFALVATSAMCLVACGGGKEKDDDNKTVKNLAIVYGHKERDYEIDIGEFEYGEVINLNYTIYTRYDDNSKKELTSSEYTTTYQYNNQEITSLPQTYEVGEYKITITYKKDNTKKMLITFSVLKPKAEYKISLSKTEWRQGENGAIISFVGTSPEDDNRTFFYHYADLNDLSDRLHPTEFQLDYHGYVIGNTVPSELAPGEYYIYVIAKEDDNYRQSISNIIKVIVLPAENQA